MVFYAKTLFFYKNNQNCLELCISIIKFPEDSIVGVINHHGQLSIARGESQLSDEDTVLVFAKSNVVSKLRKLFES